MKVISALGRERSYCGCSLQMWYYARKSIKGGEMCAAGRLKREDAIAITGVILHKLAYLDVVKQEWPTVTMECSWGDGMEEAYLTCALKVTFSHKVNSPKISVLIDGFVQIKDKIVEFKALNPHRFAKSPGGKDLLDYLDSVARGALIKKVDDCWKEYREFSWLKECGNVS